MKKGTRKMNKVILTGNLTKDVELFRNDDMTIARFTLAVQRKRKNENGEYDADFFRCTAFKKTAENLYEYCNKGDKITVVGEIQQNSYEVNGEKRYTTQIIANEIEFVNIKKTEDTGVPAVEEPVLEPVDLPADDELPF